MKPVSIRCIAAILGTLPLLSCGQEARWARPDPVNVVIVMVDTLRADHMSAYGYDRETTPFIKRFASQGFIFEHARSQASCTFPSVNSLLSSRNPSIFTRQEVDQLGIPEEYPSIAEILRENGYRTIAVSASPIVRATPSDFNPMGGFGSGFEVFVEDPLWRPGAQVSRAVMHQLDTIEEPFFLYAHYMDPHGPYQPPERFTKRFAGEYDGHDFIHHGNPVPIAKMLYRNGPHHDLTDRDIDYLIDLYDDEIRYFDDVFRRLIKKMEERGLLDRTLIIISSDHGEEFLEHGHIRHCRGVWDTVTLYDLRADPGEQLDLFRPDHPEAMRLSDALNGWLTDTDQLMRFDEELAAARAKEEELRALGYLE